MASLPSFNSGAFWCAFVRFGAFQCRTDLRSKDRCRRRIEHAGSDDDTGREEVTISWNYELASQGPPSLKGHCSSRLHSLILRGVIQAGPMTNGNFSLVRALLDGQGSSRIEAFSLQTRQLYDGNPLFSFGFLLY